MENLEKSLSAKAMGSIYLHLLSIKLNWPVRHFINGSSTCSLLGLKDECGYVSASLILDSLMKYRNQIGLYGYSINWGSISKNEAISNVFKSQGLAQLPNELIFNIINLIMFGDLENNSNNSNFIVSIFNYDQFFKILNNSNYYYLFKNLFISYSE
ncbi:hypothetical protein DICPUDRAFT_77848 [Dictyostelium purpureum]|uniref:Ketoreductase (KR) domain-containing protein n=1 Tax=Dictyostelium purpureum TaxID=5786 RepID=F0ZHT2_DICPU|nr:uncharacterized protein DICPUDRAFT_77848 [Dictyostelium purpureum]EGC36531.1 hypothetical protein DICPUDRAFT_77848 [Dictyostelium purpureum]|eukprot:XP_003286976.1 hypothetical protein DICPUDRAFT_77848 [Dictyostelium purpureum]